MQVVIFNFVLPNLISLPQMPTVSENQVAGYKGIEILIDAERSRI